jgi:hypothetical protein
MLKPPSRFTALQPLVIKVWVCTCLMLGACAAQPDAALTKGISSEQTNTTPTNQNMRAKDGTIETLIIQSACQDCKVSPEVEKAILGAYQQAASS